MKPLNQWARHYGYNDFDTYIRAGGSIVEACLDINKRIAVLEAALKDLARSARLAEKAETLVCPDAETQDEPTETDNAHLQGAELG